MEAVMELAADIATKPPLAIYGCKRIITYSRDHSTQGTFKDLPKKTDAS